MITQGIGFFVRIMLYIIIASIWLDIIDSHTSCKFLISKNMLKNSRWPKSIIKKMGIVSFNVKIYIRESQAISKKYNGSSVIH